ncbi:hypothetical protein [Streptomyces sp. SID4982]|uniref:hypothetical protein n=1 Tax=Streptomyces sp. SID4982 TaxID=2690291 RepID=UPI00136CB669|nr:hypothetical protein [Streptomyces sp. SID4982]MYS17872.1 hypothetical protein [Streptomyces sp. SID4982]
MGIRSIRSAISPAVIRRLPSFELADPEEVPIVTGVRMAAAMGMDIAAWRDRSGKTPPKEAMVHGYVLWLLADLFDSLIEKPGAMDQLMRDLRGNGRRGALLFCCWDRSCCG